MAHDFNTFPELTNAQMQIYYFESPHQQITQNFTAKVIKVHDGDTITLRTNFRDFDFPMRFIDTNAPELNEDGGHESQQWLEQEIGGEEVEIIVSTDNRVDKWGRLLGRVFFKGMDINELSMRLDKATKFENRNEGKIPNINKEINIGKWM